MVVNGVRTLGIVLALAGLLAGCSTHKPANGVISGELRMNVGLESELVTGAVYVRRGSRTGTVVESTAVGRDGLFRFVLAPGIYAFSGGSPQFNGGGNQNECFGGPVTLKPGGATSVTVACNGP